MCSDIADSVLLVAGECFTLLHLHNIRFVFVGSIHLLVARRRGESLKGGYRALRQTQDERRACKKNVTKPQSESLKTG